MSRTGPRLDKKFGSRARPEERDGHRVAYIPTLAPPKGWLLPRVRFLERPMPSALEIQAGLAMQAAFFKVRRDSPHGEPATAHEE